MDITTSQIERIITKWTVTPENQGQAVEYAYGVDWEEGVIARRRTDRSSVQVAYVVAPASVLDGPFEPWNSAPKVPSRDWYETRD